MGWQLGRDIFSMMRACTACRSICLLLPSTTGAASGGLAQTSSASPFRHRLPFFHFPAKLHLPVAGSWA